MKKVITYGTYDLLHHGHIRLLERARALGDYLIVGVTADDFDIARGKINVKQSLIERVEAVRAAGIADQIIIEEYEGQKIDDIRRYDVDIFTVGSDWEGKFDYLNEYCKVVYLPRTQGVSSTEIRMERQGLCMGFAGDSPILDKYFRENSRVNGGAKAGVLIENADMKARFEKSGAYLADSYEDLLQNCDAVYIVSSPDKHYEQIRKALRAKKHVLCESPVTLSRRETAELAELAVQQGLVLMEAIKTAYATAYNRLLLLVKSGKIGKVVSVDATCTSIRSMQEGQAGWNSICAWGPTAMLPVFQILGCGYTEKRIRTLLQDAHFNDAFTKVDFTYPGAVATVKVGQGVKSEGDLVISGTEGYIYVPAPWWKTDYFEIRYENAENNRRYFYQLEGEGISFTILSFLRAVESGRNCSYIAEEVTEAITGVIEDFYNGTDTLRLQD